MAGTAKASYPGQIEAVSFFKLVFSKNEANTIGNLPDRNEIRASKVTGIGKGIETVDYREGTDPPTVRKERGLSTVDNFTIEKGYSRDSKECKWLINWYESAHHDDITGKRAKLADVLYDITITLIGEKGEDLLLYSYEAVQPINLKFTDLDGTSSDRAIMSLECAGYKMAIHPQLA